MTMVSRLRGWRYFDNPSGVMAMIIRACQSLWTEISPNVYMDRNEKAGEIFKFSFLARSQQKNADEPKISETRE